MEGSEDPSKTEPKDSRLDSFLREAMAILSSQRDLTPEAQVKLKSLAKRLNLPKELYKKGLKLLANPQSQVPQTRWEKLFVRYLDKQFSLLPGQILTGPQESKAKGYGKRKFGLNDQQCDHWIRRVAEQKGVACISQSEALEFAEMEAKRLVQQKTQFDQQDVQRLHNASRRLGLDLQQCQQFIKHQTDTNRSNLRQQKKLRRIKLFGTGVGVVVLGLVIYGYIFHWIPEFRPVGPEEPKRAVSTGPEHEAETKPQFDWISQDLLKKIQSPILNQGVGRLASAKPVLHTYLHNDPIVRKQAIKTFFQKLQIQLVPRIDSLESAHDSPNDNWIELFVGIYLSEPDAEVRRQLLESLEVTPENESSWEKVHPLSLATFVLQCETILLRIYSQREKDQTLKDFSEKFRPFLANTISADSNKAMISAHQIRLVEYLVDSVRLQLAQIAKSNPIWFQRSELKDEYLIFEKTVNRFVLEFGKRRPQPTSLYHICFPVLNVLVGNSNQSGFKELLISRLPSLPETVLIDLLYRNLDQPGGKVSEHLKRLMLDRFPNNKVQSSDDSWAQLLWFLEKLEIPADGRSEIWNFRERFLRENVVRRLKLWNESKSFSDRDLREAMAFVNLVLLIKREERNAKLFDRIYLDLVTCSTEKFTEGNKTQKKDSPANDEQWQKDWKFLTEEVDWTVTTLQSERRRIETIISAIKNPLIFAVIPSEFLVKSAEQSIGKPKELFFAHLIPKVISNPWIRLKIVDRLQLNDSRFLQAYLEGDLKAVSKEQRKQELIMWKREALASLKSIEREPNKWQPFETLVSSALENRLRVTRLDSVTADLKPENDSQVHPSIIRLMKVLAIEHLRKSNGAVRQKELPNFDVIRDRILKFETIYAWWWQQVMSTNTENLGPVRIFDSKKEFRKWLFTNERKILESWKEKG